MRKLYSLSQNVNQMLYNDISHTFHIPLAFVFRVFVTVKFGQGARLMRGSITYSYSLPSHTWLLLRWSQWMEITQIRTVDTVVIRHNRYVFRRQEQINRTHKCVYVGNIPIGFSCKYWYLGVVWAYITTMASGLRPVKRTYLGRKRENWSTSSVVKEYFGGDRKRATKPNYNIQIKRNLGYSK